MVLEEAPDFGSALPAFPSLRLLKHFLPTESALAYAQFNDLPFSLLFNKNQEPIVITTVINLMCATTPVSFCIHAYNKIPQTGSL